MIWYNNKCFRKINFINLTLQQLCLSISLLAISSALVVLYFTFFVFFFRQDSPKHSQTNLKKKTPKLRRYMRF